MILLISVVLGLTFGLLRAKYNNQKLNVINFRAESLVFFGYLPQLLLFNIFATSQYFPDSLTGIIYVFSQALLLGFALANIKTTGFWALGTGLLLNFIVIFANGGLMPVSPETVKTLLPNIPSASWEIGSRFGFSKNIVLTVSETNFSWLSDSIFTPSWLPLKAYSIGDAFIFIGAFLLLWSLGAKKLIENIQ